MKNKIFTCMIFLLAFNLNANAALLDDESGLIHFKQKLNRRVAPSIIHKKIVSVNKLYKKLEGSIS